MAQILLIIAILSVIAVCLSLFALKIYGVILSFKKKWYIGAVAIIVPGFAEVIAIAKLLKKDLLK